MTDFVGNDGDDTFNGGAANDTAKGKGGSDHLYGGGGNDILEGGAGADYLDGGDGDDQLYSNSQVTIALPYYSTTVFSPAAIDSGSERDTLYGGDGSDRIYAGYGDTVDGGANGSYGDYLYISFLAAPNGITFDGGLTTQVIGGATITGIENISFVQGSNFDDTINGRSTGTGYSDFGALMGMGGNDTLIAGYYTGTMFGGDGNDVVDGRGSQYLQAVYGDDGDDTLYANTNTFAIAYGGAGNDTIYAGGEVHGGTGDDVIHMQFSYYGGYVYGDDGNDTIYAVTDGYGNSIAGGNGADTLIGGNGPDILASGDFVNLNGRMVGVDNGAEHDRLTGGAGDDTLYAGYGDDVDGGSGTNTLSLTLGGASSGVTLNAANILVGNFTLAGGTITNVQVLTSLSGSQFSDDLTAGTQTGNIDLYGGAGDDILRGSGSSVSFHGGAGNDHIIGGSAADFIYVDSTDDLQSGDVYEGGGSVDALMIGMASADISALILTSIESIQSNYTYSGYPAISAVSMTAAQLSGFSSLANIQITLTAAGNVALSGVNDTNVTSFTLSAFGNGLDLTGIAAASTYSFSVTGGAGADVVTGSANSDNLSGNGGNDTLYGGAGNDGLNGGDGNDILDGGTGDDSLGGGAGLDTLHGGEDNDTLVINAGDLVAGELYDGGSGADTLLINAIGSTDISGVMISNVETLREDYYYLDTITLTADQLNQFSTVWGSVYNLATSGTVSMNGKTDVGISTFNLSAAGNSFDLTGIIAQNVSTLTVNGGAGNDTITGSSSNDILTGGAGNDILDGAAGADSMSGGQGNDIYYVDNIGDVVSEQSNQGSDEVLTTLASYTLSNNVESLAGLLATGQTLNGNGLSNTIIGGDGNDILDGKAGADNLIGGLGNDIYYVDNVGDQVTETAGQGTDTVLSSVTFTLGSNVENLTLSGAAAINGTGNELANILIGNDAANVLDGGAGIDTMSGGLGDDRYVVDNVGDQVTETAGQGTDTVLSSVTFTLGANVENLTLTGTAAIDGAGNELANVLIGNAAANLLTGGSGNDTLNGGAGNDTLNGGAGTDTAVFAGNRSQYTFHANGDGSVQLVGPDGTDTVSGVERFQFSDGLYSFNFADAGAPVVANFAVGAGGWSSQTLYPRHVADVNGDGFGDIVGFGQAGVLVSYGSASGTFSNAALVVDNFGQSAGWSSDDLFHRELADVNSDGRADIIGFGQAGTLVSLARADGTFGAPTFAIADFGTAQGWSTQDSFARTTGDVNGDGKADIIGFGQAGTLVALGNGDGTFQTARFAANNFGVAQGWSSDTSFHRSVADVNGDGKADLIGFGVAGTYVALSNGDGTFQDARLALTNFGANQGWTSNDLYARGVADINHDGVADIIGFGQAGTLVAYGNGDGTFSTASFDLANFGQAQGWSSDATYHREIADINHDGLADIVGFGYAGVLVGLNQGVSLDHGGSADIVTPGQADIVPNDGTGDTTFTDANSNLANVFLAPDQSSGATSQPAFAAWNHESLIDSVGFDYAHGPTPLHQVDFLV